MPLLQGDTPEDLQAIAEREIERCDTYLREALPGDLDRAFIVATRDLQVLHYTPGAQHVRQFSAYGPYTEMRWFEAVMLRVEMNTRPGQTLTYDAINLRDALELHRERMIKARDLCRRMREAA